MTYGKKMIQIKQVKKNEVSLEKQKQEKKQLKIKDLEKIIKTQMDIIEKNNKQMEKYKKTNNPDDMTYNLSELARVKKGLKQNLDKLEKLEK